MERPVNFNFTITKPIKHRLPFTLSPLSKALQVVVQEVKDNTICLWRVLVKVDIVTCLWNKMLHELLRIAIVRISWLVVNAGAVAVAHNVIGFSGDRLRKS